MNADQIRATELAATQIDAALKLLNGAREILREAGAYQDEQMFFALDHLEDALSSTSAAFSETHMAAFVAAQA